jgi:hypothetical protein
MTMADFADQLFDAAWEVLGVTLRRQTGTRWKETGSGWVLTKKNWNRQISDLERIFSFMKPLRSN